jgi:hypothetical protein
MTAVPQTSPDPSTPFARGMAFAAYFLLLAALPTAGTSALLALIIAYARRDSATPLIRSHHQFQIRIFWIGVALVVAALALGASAWIDAWRAPMPPHHFHIEQSPDARTIAYHPGADDAHLQPAAIYSWWSYEAPAPLGLRARLESYAAMVTILVAGLWGIAAPLWGAARLASDRPIGHRAP